MKKTVFLLILTVTILFFGSCTSDSEKKSKIKNAESSALTENFDWLIGNWHRTNEKEDRETYEIWNKKSNYEYNGTGFTLQNNDTIFYESIKLVKSETGWNFEVIGKGEPSPTIFKFTHVDKGEFTCENMKVEFPKKIKYSQVGNSIKAIVSGGDIEIPFEFERVKTK